MKLFHFFGPSSPPMNMSRTNGAIRGMGEEFAVNPVTCILADCGSATTTNKSDEMFTDRLRPQRMRLLAAVTCLAAAISGCATSGGAAVISFKQQQLALTLLTINSDEDTNSDKDTKSDQNPIYKQLVKGQPAVLRDQVNAEDEAKVLAACSASPSTESAPLILGLLLSSTINVLLERVDAGLQKRIETYSSAYSAQNSVSFYNPFKSSVPDDITTNYTCLRFVRGVTGGDNESLVDFVASIKVVNSAWIEVQPERLYFSEPVVSTSKQRYGVAVKLSATSVHRAGAKGERVVAFDDVIANEKVNLEAQPYFLKYYEGKNRPVIRLPLLPSNLPTQETAREFTTFELSVAEVGVPSKGLALVAKAFSGAREDIAKVLAAAANESLGWEAEE